MRRSMLSAAAGLLLVTTVPLHAQTYTADWGYEGGAGSGFSSSPSSSSYLAAVSGYWNGGATTRYAIGRARSTPFSLDGYGAGWERDAVAATGRGAATWYFDDVVFSDGGGTPQPISVSLQLDYTGDWFHDWGIVVGGLEVVVDVYLAPRAGNPLPIASWRTGGLGPTSAPRTATPGPFSLMTNTTYELQISTDTRGFGHSGAKGWTCSRTTWGSVPFLLPAGVTANSAQARIVNNTSNPVAPAISPWLSADVPTVAGNNTSIYFSGGDPGGAGVYLFGLPPNGSNLQINPWFTIDLPLAPLVSVPFTADASGNHTVTFFVDAALSGLSFGIQAVQVYLSGPPGNGLYGTNAWTMDIQ